MSRATQSLYLDSLTLELEARGLTESAAQLLSSDFVTRHPFAQRLGMERLVNDLEKRGLESGDALGTAGLLLAIELLDRGAGFERVIRELEALGLDRGEALASSLSGARVYRAICTEAESTPAEIVGLLKGLAWFGVAVLILALSSRLVV